MKKDQSYTINSSRLLIDETPSGLGHDQSLSVSTPSGKLKSKVALTTLASTQAQTIVPPSPHVIPRSSSAEFPVSAPATDKKKRKKKKEAGPPRADIQTRLGISTEAYQQVPNKDPYVNKMILNKLTTP
jgi:hypothetical protein